MPASSHRPSRPTLERVLAAGALALAHGLYLGHAKAEAPGGTRDVPASADRTARNVLYLQLLGNALLYSVNYERFVSNDFAARIGFEYVPPISFTGGDDRTTVEFLAAPLMLNYLGIGNSTHALVLGAGLLLFYSWESTSDRFGAESTVGFAVGATGTIGYRYVPSGGGFMFDAGFTPVLLGAVIVPWAGVAAGAAF